MTSRGERLARALFEMLATYPPTVRERFLIGVGEEVAEIAERALGRREARGALPALARGLIGTWCP